MRNNDSLTLEDGSHVAVIGGGPAGSFFSNFLLDMAQRVGIDAQLDLYEPRDFNVPGPAGCNMCGGIVSESLVQLLATEGINLPPTVVERGIDSYVLHMDEGSVRIEPPRGETRIAAVHRGAGPRGIKASKWQSFDGYLLQLALAKGARLVKERVEAVEWIAGRPQVKTATHLAVYDLLAVAVGINSATLKMFDKLGNGYRMPQATKTYICEFYLGHETIGKYLGSSMHVFLLDLPQLEFAALIPKGDYVTLCLLGKDIDAALVQKFLSDSQVRQCLPLDWIVPREFCHCAPRINTRGAAQPFADRLVFIGDCGATRLYKDGIGAAYRTAKAAAITAVFEGVSANDFRRHYLPVCRRIEYDNAIGKVMFFITELQRQRRRDRRGILRMVVREQHGASGTRRMSSVMWDLFTGSAPYREIFVRTLHPFFIARLLWEVIAGMVASATPFRRWLSKQTA